MLNGRDPSADVWAFRSHPAVWVLVVGLAVAYWYVAKVLAPATGNTVSRRQVWCFASGLGLMWVMSDWPMHDLSDTYLYSAHMLQHMALSYFVPPLLLLAVPTWFARLLLGSGTAYRLLRLVTKPVFAGLLFNAWVIVSHIPGVVNSATTNLVLHYVLHSVLVVLSLMMWTAICGPIPEFRLGPAGQMIYLFIHSIIPTVPAGWLTFAEKAVYKTYDHQVRVFGLSVQYDQQLAGGVMKAGGSAFLWTLIAWLFFKRFMAGYGESHTYRKVGEQRQRTFESSDTSAVRGGR